MLCQSPNRTPLMITNQKQPKLITTCAICNCDLNSPEFRSVGHRKVLTISKAPEHLCLLCETDLQEAGAFDFKGNLDSSKGPNELAFRANQVLHSMITSMRQNGPGKTPIPGLKYGAYR